MKIDKLSPMGFGIRRSESFHKVGDEAIHTVNGKINNKNITIYNQYTKGTLTAKLMYLSDELGNFLKFKLLQFEGKKVVNKMVQEKGFNFSV